MNAENKRITLAVKNMVCPRCIRVVREELLKAGVEVFDVRLGEIEIAPPQESELESLGKILKENGFELIHDRRTQISEKIKNIIITQIHYTDEHVKTNLSKILEDELHLEYHYLSTVFSQQQGMTIEKYFILQKIELVKELLEYNQLSISEIAFKSGYSSVAHLSNQFKKITGLSATQYRKLSVNGRKTLDEI